MSAILEALKKLEQEAVEPSGHPLRREIKHQGERLRISAAGIMAVAVVICGLAGYGVWGLARKAPVAPVSAPDREAVDSSPAAPVSPAPAASPAGQHVNTPPPYQVKASHKTLSFQEDAPPAAPAREIVAVALEPEPLPEENPEEAVSPHSNPPDETGTFPETAISPADRPASAMASNAVTGIFNDPEVALQAISWSPDAGRRMAVINGKICRENEQISGYVIQRINPEDVVVSKGSATGRLVFKIR